ncbi:MAG TPA: hypothetical protein VFA45_07710 [Actinomycetes bacterium]|nr:hypothetical protein [Actinomycetes bacterium]
MPCRPRGSRRSPPTCPPTPALIGRTKFAPQGLRLLAPWMGFAVVCAYAAAALLAAAVILSRRDA